MELYKYIIMHTIINIVIGCIINGESQQNLNNYNIDEYYESYLGFDIETCLVHNGFEFKPNTTATYIPSYNNNIVIMYKLNKLIECDNIYNLKRVISFQKIECVNILKTLFKYKIGYLNICTNNYICLYIYDSLELKIYNLKINMETNDVYIYNTTVDNKYLKNCINGVIIDYNKFICINSDIGNYTIDPYILISIFEYKSNIITLLKIILPIIILTLFIIAYIIYHHYKISNIYIKIKKKRFKYNENIINNNCI